LQRADNRGRLLIDQHIYDRLGIHAHLYNGRLTLYIGPIEDKLKVGDPIVLKVGLQDDAMPQPVTDKLTVRIVDQEKEPKKEKRSRAKPKPRRKAVREATAGAYPE
jgi:hypothetical protein